MKRKSLGKVNVDSSSKQSEKKLLKCCFVGLKLEEMIV